MAGELGAPAFERIAVLDSLERHVALFNHANIRLPEWPESVLRWLVVTPDMHRVHHSIHRDEQTATMDQSAVVGPDIGDVSAGAK